MQVRWGMVARCSTIVDSSDSDTDRANGVVLPIRRKVRFAMPRRV